MEEEDKTLVILVPRKASRGTWKAANCRWDAAGLAYFWTEDSVVEKRGEIQRMDGEAQYDPEKVLTNRWTLNLGQAGATGRIEFVSAPESH